MEHPPFSNQGLAPEQLEKETPLVEKSVWAVREGLKEIHFSVINDIVLDLLSRIYPSSSREEIKDYFQMEESYPVSVTYSGENNIDEVFTRGEYVPAAYSSFPDIIIHAREIANENGELEKEDKLYLLKVLAHEIVHHLSFGVEDQEHTDIPLVHTGIAFGEPDEEGHVGETSFSLLNEAMTDILADAIISEYLARTGKLKEEYEEKRKWYQKPLHIRRYSTYLEERMMLMSFVDKLSELSSLPEHAIYQALAVEYFTNGDIGRAELIDELKEEPAIKEMIQMMKENQLGAFAHLSDDDQEKIEAVLDVKQLDSIKAFFNRDYIGDTNQKRLHSRKFYNVIR